MAEDVASRTKLSPDPRSRTLLKYHEICPIFEEVGTFVCSRDTLFPRDDGHRWNNRICTACPAALYHRKVFENFLRDTRTIRRPFVSQARCPPSIRSVYPSACCLNSNCCRSPSHQSDSSPDSSFPTKKIVPIFKNATSLITCRGVCEALNNIFVQRLIFGQFLVFSPEEGFVEKIHECH